MNENNFPIKGLTKIEAQKNLKKFGFNQLFKPEKISFFGIFKEEVTEPMILLLLVVGAVYSFWGKLDDAITIFLVITALVLAEVYNEFRAKKAIAALSKIAALKVKVLRNDNILEINSEEVVPEDILILTSGTKIAADAVIKKGISLQVDESSLTGESFPQDKKSDDKIFAGTIIVAGEGEAKVSVNGADTKIGKIAAQAKFIKPPKTKLQLAMKSLAGQLVYVAVFFSVFIPVLGILRGQDLKTMILTGLSLSFATIPEELPIVITMVLGLGAYTLSKNKFLVKKIKAAETLGQATVIVTDKTGTITEGQMKIAALYPSDKKEEILKASHYLISDYSLSPIDLAIKQGVKKINLNKPSEIIRQRNLGNGRKTKTVIRKISNNFYLFLSGAPEEVFSKCQTITEEAEEELIQQTQNGQRIIAVAVKELKDEEKDLSWEKLETNLDFIGLISFADPARSGVKETILQAKRAGIRTIMVTGDHPLTALFIAKEVGIIKDKNGQLLTGGELDKLTDGDLQEAVKKISVFARTTPEHKYRLVQALQKNGEIVAVTGDGINDALALKSADIGIAMGLRGTDVAKEAAEVVLADDNYVTIAQGIFEGRKFFDNLQKGIKYYLSVKVALILIFLLPVILDIALPLAPIQIIVLELFMDLAASAGFVFEPREKNIYSRLPISPKENLFDKSAIVDIFIKGLFLFIGVTAVYFYALWQNLGLTEAQTWAFAAWMFGHIILAFISRSDKESIFSIGLLTNKLINIWTLGVIIFLLLSLYLPLLNHQFSLTAISYSNLISIALFMVIIIGSLDVRKFIKYKFS